MSIVITGANGLFGSHLVHYFSRLNWTVYPLVRRQINFPVQTTYCNLSEFDHAFEVISQKKPTAIIHNAANGNTNLCESDPEQAYQSNVITTQVMCQVARELNIPLIFISTDLVFDGRKGNYLETDAPNPQHVYGHTKLKAEQRVSLLDQHYIFRTALLVGRSITGTNGYLDHFIQKNRERSPFYAFVDEYRSAITCQIAAFCIERTISKRPPSGIYNLASDEILNRHEIALKLCNYYKLNEQLIQQSRLEEYSGLAPRQANVSLNNQKLKKALNLNKIDGILSLTDVIPFK